MISNLYREVKARVEESLNYHFSDDPLVVTAETSANNSYTDPSYSQTELEQPNNWMDDVELDSSILE